MFYHRGNLDKLNKYLSQSFKDCMKLLSNYWLSQGYTKVSSNLEDTNMDFVIEKDDNLYEISIEGKVKNLGKSGFYPPKSQTNLKEEEK